MDDFSGSPLIIIFVLLVLLLYACVVIEAQDEKETQQWNEFSIKHHCKISQKSQGDVGGGITSNADFFSFSESDKVAYLCDDGITYWRNTD